MLKKLSPVLWFGLAYFTATLHNRFDDTMPAFVGDMSHLHNWIIFNYKPMTDAWNVNYIAWQVAIPLFTTVGLNSLIKRLQEYYGQKIPKLYRLEWKLFKIFIILNSISYFLIFRDGAEWMWIFWVLGAIGLYSWCTKNGEELKENIKDV